MYCMTRLGQMGRLGNQLFQYAFLRTLSRRQRTQFYCPRWIGDDIFNLNDATERASTAQCSHEFKDLHLGYDARAERAPDGTDFIGNFESWRYFSGTEHDVRRWYRFRPEMTRRVRERYAGIHFGNMACLHLRFGDYRHPRVKLVFFTPGAEYYRHAISTLTARHVAVFSDDSLLARRLLAGLPVECFFIEGNEAWEDLYLMTQCGHHVISASTFSWWGAWLSDAPNKQVVRPREGRFRPGAWPDNPDFYPPEWQAHRAISDSITERYWFLKLQNHMLSFVSLPGRAFRRVGRTVEKLARR
jgi:hypothetical protein